VEFALLLVQVLDESAAPLLHLVKSALESDPEGRIVTLAVFDLLAGNRVLGVPDIMGDELFDLSFPARFKPVVVHVLNFVHESLNVLNQDVIACDQDSLLLRGTLCG
jgi:hypothetical protein